MINTRIKYLFIFFFLSWCTLYAVPPSQNNFQLSLTHATNEKYTNNINLITPYIYAIDVPSLDPRYEKLIKELAYMQLFAIGTIGAIGALPENISNWSSKDKKYVDVQDLLSKHADNIAHGPVWDNDNWAVNYIGHSLAGSYFYVWGRQSGLSWQESTLLTTLMSTFFWEYGWEAFAEKPSIQDLVVTPVLGSILGEGTNFLYNRIMQNDGKIYNSTLLGSLGRGLLNPIGEMNKYLDKAFNAANIDISIDYAYHEDMDYNTLRNNIVNNGFIQSYFKLKFTFKY